MMKRGTHLVVRKLSVMPALPSKVPPTSLTLLCLLSVLWLLFGLDSPPPPAAAPVANPQRGAGGGRAHGSQGLH